MKKILACMSLVFVLSAGATALADGIDVRNNYDKEHNSFAIDMIGATEKNTILITKNDDDDSKEDEIFYVDQNDNSFSSVASFFLKGDSLAEGTYTVKMNTTDGEYPETKTFTIAPGATETVEVSNQAFRYDYTNKSTGVEEYDIGFTASATNLSKVNYIAVTDKTNNRTAYFEIGTKFSSDSNAAVAIKIKNVPKNIDISVALTATKGASN